MRKIKFMGKPVDGGDWVYGYYFKIKDMCFIASYDEHASALTWHTVIPSSVGQFTGLKDKDGLEIYGGHVVKFTGHNRCFTDGVVVFRNYSWYFETDERRQFFDFAKMKIGYEIIFEIIGTSTDNPELLE